MGSQQCCCKNSDEEKGFSFVFIKEEVVNGERMQAQDDEVEPEEEDKPDEHMQAHLEQLGVAFTAEECKVDKSLSMMKELSVSIQRKSDDDDFFKQKPALKHLKTNPHLLGASRTMTLTKSFTTKSYCTVPEDKAVGADNAEEVDGASAFELRPNLRGIWKCINTWGLEDFLRKVGVGFVQRKAAMNAPWPWWSFEVDPDGVRIHFVNHGPMGLVDEHIDTTGQEYSSIDGKKQTIKNKAYWEGNTLIIERTGPQGHYRETRKLDDSDNLQFALEMQDAPHTGTRWGRDFRRGDEDFHAQ